MRESMWMFVKAREAMWVVRRHTPSRLIVLGPGSRRQEYAGYSDAELTEIHTRFEAALRASGWTLESFTPDRRRGHERRASTRGPERRRQPAGDNGDRGSR